MTLRTRHLPALLVLLGLPLAGGCSGDDATRPTFRLPVQVRVEPAQFPDNRTYGVGRVQVRTVDADGVILNGQIFFDTGEEITPVDRDTGIIDLVFDVPIGEARRLIVEPLGSGVIPDGGGKTESGVALQGVTLPFDVDESGPVDPLLQRDGILVQLFPFIPDDLRFDHGGFAWTPMPPAEAHTVRVIERTTGGELVSREILVVEGNRIPIQDAETPGGSVIGYQVRSENRFSSSAYSDTLRLFFGPDGEPTLPE